MGLPGAGKTTLANALAPLLNAVVFNADAVRANLSREHDQNLSVHIGSVGSAIIVVFSVGGGSRIAAPLQPTMPTMMDCFLLAHSRLC